MQPRSPARPCFLVLCVCVCRGGGDVDVTNKLFLKGDSEYVSAQENVMRGLLSKLSHTT